MQPSKIPCHIRGCLFVARWIYFNENDAEQTVCLCPAHMDELARTNPSRASRFIPIARNQPMIPVRSSQAA
jgi:hypothetical protein